MNLVRNGAVQLERLLGELLGPIEISGAEADQGQVRQRARHADFVSPLSPIEERLLEESSCRYEVTAVARDRREPVVGQPPKGPVIDLLGDLQPLPGELMGGSEIRPLDRQAGATQQGAPDAV